MAHLDGIYLFCTVRDNVCSLTPHTYWSDTTCHHTFNGGFGQLEPVLKRSWLPSAERELTVCF